MDKVLESFLVFLMFVLPFAFIFVFYLSLRSHCLISHGHKNSLNVAMAGLAFICILSAVVYYI